jgi:hypothetical protein
MNPNEHDDLGTQLTRTLTEHADVMAGASFGLSEVQGRARSIRRRRTATAVAAVAAAVAIVVPTVALVTHTNGKPEPAPITQTPSPTDTATDDGHQPAPGVLDVSDLPTGESPRMEYVTNGPDGSVLHQIDGSTVDVGTRYPVEGFAALTDGSFVWQTADDRGNAYVEIQDADAGAFHEPVRSMFGLSASRSHDAAAWVDPDGQAMVWTVGASEARPLGEPVTAGSDLRISSFESDECQQGYCGVFVNVADPKKGEGQPWEVTDYATRPFLDGNMDTVADLAGGIVIGYTKITDFGSCSVLWGGGEFHGFSTCKHTLESFSPDGRLVLGTPAYPDGFGSGDIAMYDSTGGDLLFQRQSTAKAQASYQSTEWEDGSHVLAPFFQEAKWSLVRVASDGSMEYAVAPAPGGEENPFVLPTGGMPIGD